MDTYLQATIRDLTLEVQDEISDIGAVNPSMGRRFGTVIYPIQGSTKADILVSGRSLCTPKVSKKLLDST